MKLVTDLLFGAILIVIGAAVVVWADDPISVTGGALLMLAGPLSVLVE